MTTKKSVKAFGGETEPVKSEQSELAEIAYRNTLQTVAQMRKVQREFYAEKTNKSEKQALLIEAKKLETSVDMRLASLGIVAI